MFCRVCGFRVRVWESYRTSRSFGHGYGSVTEPTEVPGIVGRAYITYRSSGRVQKVCTRTRVLWHGRTSLAEVPGTGMNVIQNFQKFRIRVRKSYRTSRSSRYCGTGVQNLQKFRAGWKMLYPYPRYSWHWRTELTEVPGTGINALQNLQKFRVRVIPRQIHGLGGGARYEADDSIELAWHVLTGPTSPRQSVV